MSALERALKGLNPFSFRAGVLHLIEAAFTADRASQSLFIQGWGTTLSFSEFTRLMQSQSLFIQGWGTTQSQPGHQ